MTIRDIIRHALLALGVVRMGENPTAAEMDDARVMLNNMLNAWRPMGVDLEYLSKADLSDTMDYPEEYYTAMIFNLAVFMAPSYERPVSPEVGTIATSSFRYLQAMVTKPDTLSVDPALMSISCG